VTAILRTLRRIGAGGWLLGLAGVLIVLLGLQGIGYARMDRLAVSVEDLRAPKAVERAEIPAVDDYLPIGHKGHFGKEKKPTPKLFGVLGDEALIGMSQKDAKFFSVDAALPGGCKLVEIRPSSVVVEREGEEETLELWPDMNKPGRARPRRPHPPPGPHREQSRAEAADREGTVKVEIVEAVDMPMPDIPENLPIPHEARRMMMKAMREGWQNMSDEEKEQVKERIQKMGTSGRR